MLLSNYVLYGLRGNFALHPCRAEASGLNSDCTRSAVKRDLLSALLKNVRCRWITTGMRVDSRKDNRELTNPRRIAEMRAQKYDSRNRRIVSNISATARSFAANYRSMRTPERSPAG